MAEEVTKWIKDSKETVTLCYRNRLNRFMLLPPRVGKVLRANSQALALAREVKALGAARRGRTQTQWQRVREGGRKTEREGRFSYFCLPMSCLASSLAYFLMQAKREWTWAHKSYQNPSAERYVAEPERIRAASDVVKLDTKANTELQSPDYTLKNFVEHQNICRKLCKNIWAGEVPVPMRSFISVLLESSRVFRVLVWMLLSGF